MTEQHTDPTPLKRYTVPDPDTVSLGTAMGIKAATGVDVLNPESAGAQIAALLWWAGREDGLTFADAMQYTARDFDLEGEPDVEPGSSLDPDTAADLDAGPDPTGGPATGSDSSS